MADCKCKKKLTLYDGSFFCLEKAEKRVKKGKAISAYMPHKHRRWPPNNMPIIAHICNNVKEYKAEGAKAVVGMLAAGQLKCPVCFKPLKIHSSYERGAKESGERFNVYILICESKCEKGNALLPDFVSPWKQYGIKEVEKVITGVQEARVSDIDTAASESTVRRWAKEVGGRVVAAISVVKSIFIGMGAAVSELALDARGGFAELESLLDAAPRLVRHSGSTLGLANIWLGTRPPPAYI